MAEKLNVDTIKRISELTTVKKISDLQTIPIIENVNGIYVPTKQYENSYLLSSTYFPDNTSYGRYINYRVKISDVTRYLSTLGSADLISFKESFNNFINNLCENTANSYVQLVHNQDDTDNEYSYTFKYKLSKVDPTEVIGFSYSYIEDIGEQISTYAYTNALTPGLVNHETLEQYVRSAISRILGVPSSPAQLSEAIDSVIEFVDWFKGYTRDKDGLNELVTRIDNKDSEIITSYTAADAEINARIDNLDVDATAVEKQYITGFTQENGLIKNVTRSQIEISDVTGLSDAIDNITIDGVSTDENSFTAGGTKYTLVVDENKKLKFVEYVLMSISSKTPNTTRTLEIDSTSTEAERTFKVVANKTITSAVWSGAGSVTTSDKTTILIATQDTQNKNTTITRSVTISDGDMNVSSGDMTIQFINKRYFLGYSSDPNLIFIASNNGTNIIGTTNYHNLKDSLSTSEIYGKGFTGNGYWYLIWPSSLNIGNIYFGAGTAKAAAAGGWHEHVQNWQEGDPVTNSNHIKVNQYSTAVQYHVYRSDHPFSVQMNIQF